MYKYLFKQEVYKRHYTIHSERNWRCNEYKVMEIPSELIEENYICTCELEEPCLKVEELFHIETIDKNVKITKIIRNSNDELICYIEPIIIENEQEKTELEEERKRLIKVEELEYKNNSLNIDIGELYSFQEKVKSNFWYRFMKSKVENNYVSKKSRQKYGLLLIAIPLFIILLLLVPIFIFCF